MIHLPKFKKIIESISTDVYHIFSEPSFYLSIMSLGSNVTSTFVDLPEQVLMVGDSVSQTLCHCNEIPDVSS